MPTSEVSGPAVADPGETGLHRVRADPDSPRYKWLALSNTTLR